MNYSFEYIDIILLAMIAGFIFLRLRGILGKRTGFEGKAPPQFEEILKNIDPKIKTNQKQSFDEEAQKEFLKGARIAYETGVIMRLAAMVFGAHGPDPRGPRAMGPLGPGPY